MAFRKYQIAKLFASLVLISYVSGTLSVSLQFGKDQDQLIFPNSKRCQLQFTPTINHCTNTVFAQVNDLAECGAKYLDQIPYEKYGVEYSSINKFGNTDILLNYTVFDGPYSFYNPLCFYKGLGQENDNIIEELYSQGAIEKQVFYINIDTLKEDSNIGSIDIGNPNYFLIGQGSKFTLLKNQNGFDGYYATSNFNLYYSDTQVSGLQSITFTLSDPFIQIPFYSLNLILQQFKSRGIEYLLSPKFRKGILVNSIENLNSITIEAIAEDGSVYPITLIPEQYSRKIKDGQYQLFLKPQFDPTAIIIGYSVFQAYYVGFEFTNHQIYIAKKDSSSQSHI